MRSHRLVELAAIGLLALQLTSAAAHGAPLLYSVDAATDELVTIDAATGQVVVIGPLSRNVVDIDLAIAGGKLYGLSTLISQLKAELLEINTVTGSATFLGNLIRGTDPVIHAEALGSKNGQLFAGFTTIFSTTSNRLGELSLTGAVTNDVDAATDLDGMAANLSGQLYSNDAEPGITTNFLSSLQPTLLLGSYSGASGVGHTNDIVFAGGSLYGISHDSNSLHIISSINGSLINTVALNRTGTYLGLEHVPEPATFLLAAVGLPLAAGCARYRRQKLRH